MSHKKTPLKANPITCEVCEDAMKYLEGILTDNATETEIRAALDKMCGYLPDKAKSEVSIYRQLRIKKTGLNFETFPCCE